MVATLTDELVIDRRPALSQEEFKINYLEKGLPVIIPGAMREWSAFEKWTPEFFRNKLGNKQVRIAGKEMLLHEFMDTVIASSETNPSEYLNEVNIHREFPELLDDIEPFLMYALPDRMMSKLIPSSWGLRNGVVELLIGGKGTKFPTLHYDGYHMNTFVTQICGDKEFTFYTPDQTPYMYPEEIMANHSRVNDAHNPDLEKFPLFANARPIKVIVREGDTIFLPSGWWHTTRLLTLSIAVSTNSIGPMQWNDFVNDMLPGMTPNKTKRKVLKIYLGMAGSLMSLNGK